MGVIRIRLAVTTSLIGLALIVIGVAIRVGIDVASIVAGLALLGLGLEELRGKE